MLTRQRLNDFKAAPVTERRCYSCPGAEGVRRIPPADIRDRSGIKLQHHRHIAQTSIKAEALSRERTNKKLIPGQEYFNYLNSSQINNTERCFPSREDVWMIMMKMIFLLRSDITFIHKDIRKISSIVWTE